MQRPFHKYVFLNDIWEDILKRNYINSGIVPKLFKEKWSYHTYGNTFCIETIYQRRLLQRVRWWHAVACGKILNFFYWNRKVKFSWINLRRKLFQSFSVYIVFVSHTDFYFSVFLTYICWLTLGRNHVNAMNVTMLLE